MTTTAQVVGAAATELHPNSAVVLVFVNQATTSKERPDPSAGVQQRAGIAGQGAGHVADQQVRSGLDCRPVRTANDRRSVCACSAALSRETTQSGTAESNPWNVAATTCNSVCT